MSAFIKVRSTYPGREYGIREWSENELYFLGRSFQREHPDAWRKYLQLEQERGLITDALHERLLAHFRRLFPDLGRQHYLAGVTDLRFACHKQYDFRLWRAENREERRKLLPRVYYSHGNREWTDEELEQVVASMEFEHPEVWASHTFQLDRIGHSNLVQVINEQMDKMFDRAADISISGNCVAWMADRRLHFWMLRPENTDLRLELMVEWDHAQTEMEREEFIRRVVKRYPRPKQA